MKRLAVLFITLTLTSCASLDLRNAGKSAATTGVAYVIGGPIAGIGVLATAMAYDELVPDSPKVADIETKEQAVAYVADSLIINSLYGFIAFLLITNILVPWLAYRRSYIKAKNKYKNA
jgi:hypothetical protein